MHFGSMQRSGRSNTVECLEVFDAAQHAQHTYSQCRYRLGKPSGYAPGIGAALEGYGRGGCAEAMERGSSLRDACPPLVSIRVLREGKGDMCGREWTCVAIDRRMGGRLCCLLLSLALV